MHPLSQHLNLFPVSTAPPINYDSNTLLGRFTVMRSRAAFWTGSRFVYRFHRRLSLGYFIRVTDLEWLLSHEGRKEENVLFNDALNTFYLRLYGVRHMVKDHSDSEREETNCRHMGYCLELAARFFICIIP